MQNDIQTNSTAVHDEPLPKLFRPPFPALELVTKPNLRTDELAYYLNRSPQTLRDWAATDSGPIKPLRIHGLLAWSTAEAKALAGVTA